MTYDPFQTYPTLGAYSGVATPFGMPYNPLTQTQGINPAMGMNPQFGQQGQGGIPGYGASPGYGGIHPQQLQQLQQVQQLQQLAAALASQIGAQQWQHPYANLQNPLLTGLLQNPQTGFPQNPLQNPLLQNPLLQNPLLNPILAQTSPFGQQQQLSPYQQIGQFGQQLQPQTWVGQGGFHPLAAHFGGRGFGGISPWA